MKLGVLQLPRHLFLHDKDLLSKQNGVLCALRSREKKNLTSYSNLANHILCLHRPPNVATLWFTEGQLAELQLVAGGNGSALGKFIVEAALEKLKVGFKCPL